MAFRLYVSKVELNFKLGQPDLRVEMGFGARYL